MSMTSVDVGEPLAALLRGLDQSPDRAARELIVLELYRRGAVSGGWAAELLGMSRLAFMEHTSKLGIAVFTYIGDGFDAAQTDDEGV